ncbi:unnamed protein product [Mesocestoides corti]|uniref:Uncharacterized protein n=1 Tax=Mesocestoides corti TaxID=53468 RepID=A0A0R3UCK7_MESCO|nr:unnamed protein product [Mesocestoides corti]
MTGQLETQNDDVQDPSLFLMQKSTMHRGGCWRENITMAWKTRLSAQPVGMARGCGGVCVGVDVDVGVFEEECMGEQ